jgi:DNA transposition AAA+ family ATPase
MTTPTSHPRKPTAALRQDLHDLSQPLTRLQWRLELGQRANDADELRETIEGALADSRELMDWVRRIRSTIEAEENAR